MTDESRCVAVGRLTRVRAFTRRDVDRWLDWPCHEDPLYSGFDPPAMSVRMRDAWFDDLVHRQGQVPFAIDTLERRMIGRLFLRHIRREEGTSILGIDLDPRSIGRGFGTDALQAFLRHYFSTGVFRRMLLSVGAYNTRARRSYERCGFREIGTHWDRFTSLADVLRDPRYASIRHLFRRTARGVEALMYDMVAERPARFASARRSGEEVPASVGLATNPALGTAGQPAGAIDRPRDRSV